MDTIPWIAIAIVGLTLIGLVVFLRRRKEKRNLKDVGKQFLIMGVIWVIMGLAYGIWRDTNVFDIAFFNLGLIFTLAGLTQLLISKYRAKNI